METPTAEQHRDDLLAELVGLRSVINAAEARCAQITVELATLDDGHPLGCTSTVQFLSWQAGLSAGGTTDLDNLVLLCSWHHRLLHDGHLDVTMVDGRPCVVPTDRHAVRVRPPPVHHLPTAAAAAGLTPRRDAAHSRWEGDHIDWACFDAAYLNRPQRD